MPYKTTKKDFEVFKAECRKWVKYFGLIDWDIYYYHDESDDDCRGSCTAENCGKLASVRLGVVWDYKPKRSELKRVAFHEVCEVLTAPLSIMAYSRYVTPGEIESATHYIIRVLENTIFERGI